MITSEQVKSLKLGIAPINDRTCRIVGSAFDWIKRNTTLEIDVNDPAALEALPDCVGTFIIHYFDVMTMTAGVTSESIEGLSQSFSTENKQNLIWQYAEETLDEWLKSKVRFVKAEKRW